MQRHGLSEDDWNLLALLMPRRAKAGGVPDSIEDQHLHWGDFRFWPISVICEFA
jgi:hypothetical protein